MRIFVVKKVCIIQLLFLLLPVFGTAGSKVKLEVKLFPEEASIRINEKPCRRTKGSTVCAMFLEPGSYNIKMQARGYLPEIKTLNLRKNTLLEEKLEKKDSSLEKLFFIDTGEAPKSVRFSPDGNYLVAPLLRGNGTDVFDSWTGKQIARMIPPEPYASKHGFVDSAFLKRRGEIWVSQMTTGMVHIFDSKTFVYRGRVDVKGTYPKVILFDREERFAYVSNWLTHNISVIDVEKRETVYQIPMEGIPRGMVFSPDQKYLYAALFDTGEVKKVEVKRRKVVKVLDGRGGAKRHLIMNPETKRLFASDMSRGAVYVYSLENDKLLKKIWVGKKSNTIELSLRLNRLFVSCRGPNNAETYLKKGPRFGKVYVIDTESLEVKEWIWGGNQPTGLDVSPGGLRMVFTDFLDDRVEVYRVLRGK
jgi:DNA-binding beta-propeller fold protein YncE